MGKLKLQSELLSPKPFSSYRRQNLKILTFDGKNVRKIIKIKSSKFEKKYSSFISALNGEAETATRIAITQTIFKLESKKVDFLLRPNLLFKKINFFGRKSKVRKIKIGCHSNAFITTMQDP